MSQRERTRQRTSADRSRTTASNSSRQIENAPVQLKIEELLLDGFDPSDRYKIRDGLERELTNLLAEQGIASTFAKSISIDRLNAGSFPIPPGMSTLDQGSQLARTVHRAFELSDNSTGHRRELSQANGNSRNSLNHR